MTTDIGDSARLPVLASDILALRGTGLGAAETWALLCQAAQALQDLFLSNGGVVGGGSRAGPVVTPHTIELTPRGRVTLQMASPDTARAYLPPEYRPGRVYSDTDSEKMWMFSLGRALLDTTPRVAALTGSVSVSPTSALQSVLAAMTEPDPQRRASLMNLLDVISEYCRSRMLTKPFTHIVMDMYREVLRSPQYLAQSRLLLKPQQHQYQLQQNYNPYHNHLHSQPPSYPPATHYSKHGRGALFKSQSRNSRSHPNLPSLSRREDTNFAGSKHQFQSQMNIKSTTNNLFLDNPQINHARTNSQPIYSECSKDARKSLHNLAIFNGNTNEEQQNRLSTGNSVYSDPIYAFPVKPFLSSQDVRVNGLSAKNSGKKDLYAQPIRVRRGQTEGNTIYPEKIDEQLPLHVRSGENIIYATSIGRGNRATQPLIRQYSNPQLPNRGVIELGIDGQQQMGNRVQQQNLESSIMVSGVREAVPPKPPRTMINFNGPTDNVSNKNCELAPPKPPRNAVRNGPRARRGKPVQRAPSRLYRANTGPLRCLNKTQCVGPEFVVRANQPPKLLTVGDKKNSIGRIVVILLSGQRIDVTCDPSKIAAGELFQAIVQTEGLAENFTLGLAALLAGDFAMLPHETKLSKVAPPGWLNSDKNKGPVCLPTSFMLYLRQRFFLTSLRGIRSWISKHLLYLQLRRCILEQQLVCSLPQLINLTGLALQAEFGNYSVNEHGRGNYFLLEHYIPEALILNKDHLQSQMYSISGLTSQLHQAHRNRRGLDANSAEELFITHAQELEDYGLHLYIATIDTKELEKIINRLKKAKCNLPPPEPDCSACESEAETRFHLENIAINNPQALSLDNYCNIEPTISPVEQKINYNNASKENIYAIPKSPSIIVNPLDLSNLSTNDPKKQNLKTSRRKSERNIWFGIHSHGIKLFERTGEPREVAELVRLQWRDIQTLSYNKNCLVIYTKFNNKRTKLKLRMEHKKSFYAFKLTSLHHQFFLKLRSELTSLQGLTKDFGVPLIPAPSPCKNKLKLKISLANTVNLSLNEMYPSIEDYQNKENENPINTEKNNTDEQICYTPEEDALYAQVNARLEPEGASRDTEDEAELAKIKQSIYDIPKFLTTNIKNPEELYAAINKAGCTKKADKSLTTKVKTSSLPNYGTPRQSNEYRTPSLPRRLGVKMGTRAIYSSSCAPKDLNLTDDLESCKSDTASSIISVSVQSTDSPMPEAYVLNADIRTDDETFCVPNDETMSASLMARLEELSFAEERILRTIKLERGYGGSIGLQVTEGTDGGVYVQAVSVGGSADMAGNIAKGDRIVAINGQSLLNFKYEDALKLLQSSSCEMIELVLSQGTSSGTTTWQQQQHSNYQENYGKNEGKLPWLACQRIDVASVVNTSSAYSSAASSAMGNHGGGCLEIDETTLNSASMLLSLEDFDISRTSHQVFI